MEAFAFLAPAGAAMLQLGLCCLVGIAFGGWPRDAPLLGTSNLKQLSNAVYWLFTPCLLLSTFGAKLTPALLADSGGAVLWCLLHAGVNYLVGGVVLPRLVAIERHFAATFTLAATFNNGASVPLLVFAGLVKAPQLRSDVTAYDRAVVLIFLYVLLWNAVFWGAGVPIMQADVASRAQQPSGGGGSGSAAVRPPGDSGSAVTRLAHSVAAAARKALLTPPMLGIAIGVVVGMWPALGSAMFGADGWLAPVGGVTTLLGAPSVPISNLILGGSLYHGIVDLLAARRRRRAEPVSSLAGSAPPAPLAALDAEAARTDQWDAVVVPTTREPPAVATVAAATVRPVARSSSSLDGVAFPSSSPHTLGSPSLAAAAAPATGGAAHQPLDDLAVPCAASPTPPPRLTPSPPAALPAAPPTVPPQSPSAALAIPTAGTPPPAAGASISMRTAMLLVVTRLVLCPAILITLFLIASRSGIRWLGASAANDPILRLLIVVEAASPSAQSVLLLCQLTSNAQAAKDLSLVYVAMYPLSLLTMTVALSVGMSEVFG